MNLVRPAALIACCSILIGCQPSPSTAQATGGSASQCDASLAQTFVGEQASPELLDQARRKSKAATARIVRPGEVVTLEYNAHRLTLKTDESLKIQRISCG